MSLSSRARAGAVSLASAFLLAAVPTKVLPGRVVELTSQPGSALEKTATKLVADDLADAAKAHEKPVMLVGSARLAPGRHESALFVQVQSSSLCGSAGCATSVYVKHGSGWTKVLDSISGPISVAPGTHHGFYDLLIHGNDRWVWTGAVYRDTLPAPRVEPVLK